MREHRVSFLGLAAALAVALCIVVVPATADDPEGEVQVGVNWFVDEQTSNSAKFEEYGEVPNGFTAERFRLSWRPNDRFYLNLNALDIAQDDQQINFEMGGQDRWSLGVEWLEIPHNFSDFAREIHAYQGGGVYTITDPVGDFGEFVVNNAHDVSLRTEREHGTVDLTFTPTDALTFGITASRDRKDGTMPTIGSAYAFAGVGGSEFAFPIDWTNDVVTGRIEYAGERFNVGGQYMWSDFTNDSNRLFWEYPLAEPPDPSSEMQMDQGNDSEMRQWMFWAAGNLPGRTRISATASQGTIENNDTFLPLTVNADLLAMIPAGDRLAGKDLDGEYDTAHYDLRVTGHPTEYIGWDAFWSRHEMERDGREYEIRYVAADDHISELRRTLNVGYDKDSYGAGIKVTPVESFDFGLKYRNDDWERENTAMESTDEDTYKAYLDVMLRDRAWIRGSYMRQERRGHHYDEHYLEHESFVEGEAPGAVNAGSRRFIWADRDRDTAVLDFEFYPTENFSIYGQARWYSSDYIDPNTGQDIGTRYLEEAERREDIAGPETYSLLLAGRSEDEGSSYTLGFSVDLPRNFTFYADYTWESLEYTIWSRERGRDGALNNGNGAFGDDLVGFGTDMEAQWTDWMSENEDKYETATLGFQARFPDSDWDLDGSFVYHRGEGSYDQRIVRNEFDDSFNPFPPDVESEMISAMLLATYHARDNLSFGFGYRYEKWDEDDWQWDFNETFMGRSDQDPGNADGNFSSFLGTNYQDYENHILTLNLRYRF